MLRKVIALAALGLAFAAGPASAAGQPEEPKSVAWSFAGPFGKFDTAQVQRGYKVYREVCAACHSMDLMFFRNLGQKGGPFFDAEFKNPTENPYVKALAKDIQVNDIDQETGDTVQRAGTAADKFPSPFPNVTAAKASNGGLAPPDLSLITKSRPGWYGTINQLINGIGGPQYVYSVLTGYTPDDQMTEELKQEQPEGKYHNPYFANGHWIGMPPPLSDGAVTFDDGTPNTVDQMARDVSAFLAWTAEPKMEERKRTGFMVLIYLVVNLITDLLYAALDPRIRYGK